MKIAVAQTKPVKGDIQANIANHKKWIALATAQGADTIIFPELSLTGYEPALAKELATGPNDSRLDDFQKISDANGISIGAGIPTPNDTGISITMVIFQPGTARQTYSKKYLHADEIPFFVSGHNAETVINSKPEIALAICYELSVPEHSANACKTGAKIYIASVAKTAGGVEKAYTSLSEIARKYTMTVLMSNSVGPSDNFVSAGQSAAWNNKGELLGQLNDTDEGILMIDTDKQEIIEKPI